VDRGYWTKQLEEAERELDAATHLSDVKAAGRLQRAKAALKEWEQERRKGAETLAGWRSIVI
jgi:hypothetical protein